MSFSNPDVFWSLLILIPIGLIWFYAYRRGKEDLLKLSGYWRGQRIHSIYLLKSFFSALLLILSFSFLITAWAGPSWGSTPVEEPQEGLDIALCVDVSQSMLAGDGTPTRLDQAKQALRSLLADLPQARFSLVVFKGMGFTQMPLTPDKEVLERLIEELQPAILTAPSSNLELGVMEALRTLEAPTAHHKIILVLSDGESREGNVMAAARKAASLKTEIFALGLGSLAGARIAIGNDYLKDDFGFPVQTRLIETNLKILAQETGGKYYQGTNRATLQTLQDNLAYLGNSAIRGGVKLEAVPQYRLFLLGALLSLSGFLAVRLLPWKGIF